jgi:hypothetical protein
VFEYTVDVGFTTQRPVVPDQHTSRVVLLAEDDQDALLTAFYMVDSRKCVEMVTRTEIVTVVL